jgi:hypothetical protein
VRAALELGSSSSECAAMRMKPPPEVASVRARVIARQRSVLPPTTHFTFVSEFLFMRWREYRGKESAGAAESAPAVVHATGAQTGGGAFSWTLCRLPWGVCIILSYTWMWTRRQNGPGPRRPSGWFTARVAPAARARQFSHSSALRPGSGQFRFFKVAL